MEQRRGPGKPFHSAGGIRSGILPALLRDAQADFRAGAETSWQKKRLRAASSALVGPVRAALEADGEIVRRLAGRYALDALQLGRALNDYYHHEQPPGAFADLQERIVRTARTMRRGVLNEHGLQGSEERGETFAKTCADQAVRGLRRRVLASLIMAMNRIESRSEKKPENAGEAVEKAMQRAIDSAPRLAQDTGSRVLADATVDVAAEHDMLAVWRAATGECDYCRKLDGKPVDMGDGRGVHMLPPAHDGCTCTVELTAREKVYPKKEKAAIIGIDGEKFVATMNRIKQLDHIEGTAAFENRKKQAIEKGKPPQAMFSKDVDVEQLVQPHVGRHDPQMKAGGTAEEFFDASDIVGKYWEKKTGQYEPTKRVCIRYNRSKGWHAYPTNVKGGEPDGDK